MFCATVMWFSVLLITSGNFILLQMFRPSDNDSEPASHKHIATTSRKTIQLSLLRNVKNKWWAWGTFPSCAVLSCQYLGQWEHSYHHSIYFWILKHYPIMFQCGTSICCLVGFDKSLVTELLQELWHINPNFKKISKVSKWTLTGNTHIVWLTISQ